MISTFARPKMRPMDHFVFVCQECGGDLQKTTARFAGDPIWWCSKCGLQFVYTLAGWGRIPKKPTLSAPV